MKTKICRTCNMTKELYKYTKHESNLDGYRLDCKECCRIKEKEKFKNFTPEQWAIHKKKRQEGYKRNKKRIVDYYTKNKEKLKEGKQKYNKTLRGKFMAWRSKAKQRGIDWQLTLEYIDAMPLVCYYTKQELTLEKNKSNTISLDRKDSLKGYTKDNVVFCTAIINIMKSDLTITEFLDNCRLVVKNN